VKLYASDLSGSWPTHYQWDLAHPSSVVAGSPIIEQG